jgi:hypothetical protein
MGGGEEVFLKLYRYPQNELVEELFFPKKSFVWRV